MRRPSLSILLAVTAAMAVPVVAPGLAGAAEYRFTPGRIATYAVETKQTVAWDSAGDHLTYVTTLVTNQAWRCVAVEGGKAQVEATILRVAATHKGPGADYRVNSSLREANDDPLLGHLVALEGMTLRLSIDQATGATTVTGGGRIAEAIAKRAPNPTDPTGPSPLGVQAANLYSDATLSRTWSQTLALPSPTPLPLPLGEPLTGSLLRTWTGDTWLLSGTVGGTAVLAKDPTPVTAIISAAGGSGASTLGDDGWPKVASGTLEFTQDITALTQPVHQRHTLAWRLARTAQ